MKIAIDAMGGDRAPEAILRGVSLFYAKRMPEDVTFLIFGDQDRLSPLLKKFSLEASSQIIHTDEAIPGDAKPSACVRGYRKASMRLALEAVSRGEADVVVSAGNTGAYLALARLLLKRTPSISRPAIASQMPTLTGEAIMLDLGGSLEASAHDLVSYGIMGSAFARKIFNLPCPRIGILNVGSEESKGRSEIREAASLLRRFAKCDTTQKNDHPRYESQKKLNHDEKAKTISNLDDASSHPFTFVGYVEGDQILKGHVDIIITDGFSGNVALKTGEGAARIFMQMMRQELSRTWYGRVLGLMLRPLLRKWLYRIDPRRYNGALWLGLEGVAVKSHGGADALGFSYAIETAADMVTHGVAQACNNAMKDIKQSGDVNGESALSAQKKDVLFS